MNAPTNGSFPRVFGPYVLVAELGRGGMGEVYLAWSGNVADIAKLCVIKTMRPDVAEPEVAHRRFLDEARISVSLSHANICAVYDVGQVGEVSYIAMEYAGRRTLRDMQNRARELGAGLPEDVAIWIVSRVLEGLDHAHHARDPMTGRPLQVVHRDVSPQNVMVRPDGAVKLIDFGLARSAIKVEQTQTGMVAGKLAYMAPEQVRSDPVDARIDQFAAAVMLYELISGERFYEGLREHEIWGAAATGDFRPRRWDVISPDLEVVLSVALASEPKDRFPTCEAFLEALSSQVKGPRALDARRFKQVMKELFPHGEEEERSFLQALPEHSAVRALASVSGGAAVAPKPADPAPPVAAAPPGNDENTAALAARIRPSRWPLVAAAAALVVLVGVGAAVALQPAGADDEETLTTAEPPGPVEATPPDPPKEPAEPVEARSSTDAVVAHSDPVEEPNGASEANVPAPTNAAEPNEPAANDDVPEPRVDQRHTEPRPDRKPHRATPSEEPSAPVKAAAEPKPRSELDEVRATLARCEDGCAAVWTKQLAGRTSVPENARTSLRICLDRCQRGTK